MCLGGGGFGVGGMGGCSIGYLIIMNCLCAYAILVTKKKKKKKKKKKNCHVPTDCHV